ncbi:uncharacterized protein LOC133398900 isoform X2 [Phycodurus eques]|uniref:uncharacterized protein LOC133398900 isoform X2 n=1 Tax=Phycodurus eques TaxID=693459 RepID=UPI002ACE871F|nr:uncharacterized protein LOC133398900 isoform X2 [Phycodurus eques]
MIVCKICARTTAKYEKELSGTKEKDEPRRQLVDAVRMQPRVVLHRAERKVLRSSCENVCKDSRVRGGTLGPKRGEGATTSTAGRCVQSAASNCATQSSLVEETFVHAKSNQSSMVGSNQVQ